MKTKQILFVISFILSTAAAFGQEEAIAERLGAHKEWNVAFVRDLQINADLSLNAILIQAYSDPDWDLLLFTMGKSSERLCSNDYAGNVVFWLADKSSLRESSPETEKEDDCFVMVRCSERTVALFFPHSQSDRDRILSSYLSKGQMELHQFAQRHRKGSKK